MPEIPIPLKITDDHTDPDTQLAAFTVRAAMRMLSDVFEPQMRLTFIARDPNNDSASMVVTNDIDRPAAARVLLGITEADKIPSEEEKS